MPLAPGVTIIHPPGARRKRRYRKPRPLREPRGLRRLYMRGMRRELALQRAAVLQAFDAAAPLFAAADPMPRADGVIVLRADMTGKLVDSLIERLKEAGGRFFRSAFARTLAGKVVPAVVDHHRGEFDRQVLQSVGVNIYADEPWLAGLLDQAIAENVGLITSIGDLQGVEQVVRRSVLSGGKVTELRADIQRVFGVKRSRADLIARDQTQKVHSQINRARQKAIGVTRCEWLTVGDERVRSRHRRASGVIYLLDNPPPVGPGGRPVHPGEDYQCRCQAIPVLSDLLSGLRDRDVDIAA